MGFSAKYVVDLPSGNTRRSTTASSRDDRDCAWFRRVVLGGQPGSREISCTDTGIDGRPTSLPATVTTAKPRSSLGVLATAIEEGRKVAEGGTSTTMPGLRISTKGPSLLDRAATFVAGNTRAITKIGQAGTAIGLGAGATGMTSIAEVGRPFVLGGPSTGLPSSSGLPDPLGLGGDCPGLTNVKIGGVCVDVADILPGGQPAVTGQTTSTGASGAISTARGTFAVTNGVYGAGFIPRVEVVPRRVCPEGTVLGKDGVCYEGLGRNSPRRAHRLGVKPLMTAGDRAAIRKAKSAATKLERAKKSLKKTARALEKVT